MTSRQEEMKERKWLAGSTTDFTTYHQLTSTDVGGRFAIESPRPRLSGEVRETKYPRLPDTSPWSGPQVPDEPPLGFSIDEQECCGQPFEIEQSLKNAASSVIPSEDASAPPLELTQSDSTSGGELSRVASTGPKVDASTGGGSNAKVTSSPLLMSQTPPVPPSGSIPQSDLDELLGRLIVPAGKERAR
jgi:hypothetical protein